MKTRRSQMVQIGRLLKRADFLRVQGAGKKWVTPTCVVQMTPFLPPSGGSGFVCRYGLTIPKKIWKNAVDRNRVRRRVRAVILGVLATATEQGKIPPGMDFVFLPRPPAHDAPIDQIEKDLKWAIKRLMGG